MTLEAREVGIENVKLGLNAIGDILDDLRRQLDKFMEPDGESLVCDGCDAGMDLTLAQALKEGWRDITYEPSLPQANFLGQCPTCIEAHEAEEARLNEEYQARQRGESVPKEALPEPSSKPKGTLFD